VADTVDVVVVAYNRYELTESCLRHLQRQTIDHNVVVVDNGSRDDTYARLRAEWLDVHVERFEDSCGYPQAANRGVAAGTGDIVVLLNNDVDVGASFLERAIAPMRDAEVGSVAVLLMQPGGERIDSVGMTADTVLAAYPRLRGLPSTAAGKGHPVLLGPGGAAGVYRRSAWTQVGGMDEAIDFYMEDFDLALRLGLAGWRTVAEPGAIGVHLGSATFGRRNRNVRRHGGFGRGYLLRRYGLLRGPRAARTVATETIVVFADTLISRDLAALRGRVAGWRAGGAHPQLTRPPARFIDSGIGFCESLVRRLRLHTERSA
jgi:N-acetylglucosaminyl-diphospho-decaprenol L-rhamnosyltransferase